MNGNHEFSILIVDDEKTNLDVLNHILKTEYTIYIAKSGNAAITRAEEHKPDLILLDILMPDMSGFDVLFTLKESDATRHIPVIFITGLANAKDEERGFLLGAVDYITKPFNNAVVKARIKTHLQIIKQMRTIERLGMIDALTNIPNRRFYDDRIATEWARAQREHLSLSLLMMDVDNFKEYNDTYGHPQGDVLLQTIAKIFTSCINRAADLPARIGGEEFAILLPNTDLAGAIVIAEKIRAAVEETEIPTMDKSYPSTSTTISIGIAAMIPTTGDCLNQFIMKADKALYAAKNAGKNRVETDRSS